MIINAKWTFFEAIKNINQQYKPGAIGSGTARIQSIEQWIQLVGKERAMLEINKALADSQTKNNFYKNYHISRPTLSRIMQSISSFSEPDIRKPSKRAEKMALAYHFLAAKDKTGEAFSIEELSKATGWTISTCQTYPTKAWKPFIVKAGKAYMTSGFANISLEEFKIIHSQTLQKNTIVSDPNTRLEKAREFAQLAISVYNNPFIHYKTYGFILNMIIAYTALFQAIFDKKAINYRCYDKKGLAVTIDGEHKTWDLSQCCEFYWQNEAKPEIANLKFLIGLKNKIENKNLPAINFAVSGECQSALSNFEDLLINEFGDESALCESLAIAIPLTKRAEQTQIEALDQLQSENYKIVREYIATYRQGLSDEVFCSQKYRLRAFLVPKLANHAKNSDLAIELSNIDELNRQFSDVLTK